MKTWQQILIEADAFVKFLSQDSLYAKPYNGGLPEEFVLTDATIARLVASGGRPEGFEDWESLTDSINTFPEDFEWNRSVKSKLQKNKYFDLESKNFNGAIEKWSTPTSCLLLELIYRDIDTIFQCYANNHFPDIWVRIMDAYLNDGFPCGWKGNYPEGSLIVFSNSTSALLEQNCW